MDQTWYQQFEEEIQIEIDTLFTEICEKKKHISQLISEYLEEENEFQNFLDQYEAYFQQYHLRTINLKGEILSLKSRLQHPNDSDEIIDLGGLLGEENQLNDEPSENNFESEEKNKSNNVSFIDFEQPVDDYESETIRLRSARESIKKQIARTFLWIYHPKRIQETKDNFLNKRSGLVTQLMNNPLCDAVEIILRLPFEQRDRILWEQPLPKQGSDGTSESIGDRWYRYNLWNRMLDVALPKAEAIASAPPHELYPRYLEMKRRKIQMLFYFQELEVENNKEIEELEQSVVRLKQEINQRMEK